MALCICTAVPEQLNPWKTEVLACQYNPHLLETRQLRWPKGHVETNLQVVVVRATQITKRESEKDLYEHTEDMYSFLRALTRQEGIGSQPPILFI